MGITWPDVLYCQEPTGTIVVQTVKERTKLGLRSTITEVVLGYPEMLCSASWSV